jgi:hypothetical protein
MEADPEATRRAYRGVATGDADTCGCPECRNYVVARPEAFGPAVRDFLDRLGIDWSREERISHRRAQAEASILSTGRFHFVGRLLAGADCWTEVPVADPRVKWSFERQPLHPIDDRTSVGLSSRRFGVPETFAKQPVVRLDFDTVVPWRLDEEQPAW